MVAICGEAGAAGALAALDLVAGDADVVGGRAPAEIDLGRPLIAVAVSVPGAVGGVVSGAGGATGVVMSVWIWAGVRAVL